MEMIKINETDLQIKMWNGQRVVTLADIDRVHERPEGTAKTRFYRHKERFVENEDFYVVKPSDVLKYTKDTLGIDKVPNRGLTLITESGYLMIVKTYDDDLAWKVQRDLVNTYFKFQEVVQAMEPTETGLALSNGQFLDALDTLTTCAAIFQNMIDYSTINYKQSQDLLQVARKRINHLLGGAHSEEYKKYSRIYFKNLWQDFCKAFECGSYKDLNPLYMADDVAKNWLMNWEYKE